MKKIVAFLAAAVMALSFTSCDKKGGNDPEQEDVTTDTVPEGVTTINRVQQQPMGSCIAYMLYEDANQRVFVFPINLSSGQEDVVLGKTYTLDDMNKVYAYWMLSDYTTHGLYTEATFKKNESGDTIHIDATVKDEKGDSWTLLFEGTKE